MSKVRASVITNLHNNYNLREMLNMESHKYIGSTDRYRTDILEDLQKELEKYHPLNTAAFDKEFLK
jgi:integrase/recombinase XerD